MVRIVNKTGRWLYVNACKTKTGEIVLVFMPTPKTKEDERKVYWIENGANDKVEDWAEWRSYEG
jgi:hypothetical protein